MLSYRQFIRGAAVASVGKTLRLKAVMSVQAIFTRGFASVETEEEDGQTESQPMETRSYWRSEIPVPDYAKQYVRSLCKRFPHVKREEAWKESMCEGSVNRRYLASKRSRDAKKNFLDWGNEPIVGTDRMAPLVYDEITSIAHTEFRIAKE